MDPTPTSPTPTGPLDRAALLDAARAVRLNAYAPYSRFRVGAALLAKSGALYKGVNVENASYPVGCCAERHAIAALWTAGEREAVAVAVVTDADVPVLPCGMCAQALFELNPDLIVVAQAGAGGPTRELTMREILPHAYQGEGLERR
jgi:cytidine deaminase